MARRNEYDTSLGSAFKKALEKGGNQTAPKKDTSPSGKAVVNKAKAVIQPVACTTNVQPVQHRANPLKPKLEQHPNLFYAASKRTSEQIRKEFYDQAASLAKKKGILEGVRTYYFKLSKPHNGDPATVHALYEMGVLKAEFEKYLQDVSQGRPPKNPLAATTFAKPTANVTDSAPAVVVSARKQFAVSLRQQNDDSHLRELDAVIGLDFGTSCTKVIVGTPYEQERAFLVPFAKYSHKSSPYLLPTHIDFQQGYYQLPSGKIKGSHDDLKLKLIQSMTSADYQHSQHAVAYLALVLRYVRTWFVSRSKELFGPRKIVWHVNFGIPSETYVDNDLTDLYRKAAIKAWSLSVQDGDITSALIEQVAARIYAMPEAIDQSVFLDVFPEVAAEVAGYARSEHRQTGLHLMVDVGAATLDVCGFKLERQQGTDYYPLLASKVNLLGACQLDKRRRMSVNQAVEKMHQKLLPDMIEPVENSIEHYIPDCKAIERELHIAQKTFFDECKVQIKAVAWALRKNYKADAAWKNGLPIFLCGGGNALDMYKGLVDEMSSWLQENTTTLGGAKSIPLDKPQRLEGDIDSVLFHRFAVAWGLSWPSGDIGTAITNLKSANEVTAVKSNNWWELPPDYHLSSD